MSTTKNVYQEHGYYNREDYLRCLSEDWDMPFMTVKMLADMLGPNEDFDGLVTALEDADEMEDLFMQEVRYVE